MAEETFVDMCSDTAPLSFLGWHCVICGTIVDPLIVQHHADRPKPAFAHARKRKNGVSLGPARSKGGER